jgi:hypothetical protein
MPKEPTGEEWKGEGDQEKERGERLYKEDREFYRDFPTNVLVMLERDFDHRQKLLEQEEEHRRNFPEAGNSLGFLESSIMAFRDELATRKEKLTDEELEQLRREATEWHEKRKKEVEEQKRKERGEK